MKTKIKVLLLVSTILIAMPCLAGNQKGWVWWGNDPESIVTEIAEQANKGATNVQDTKLDQIDNQKHTIWRSFQITNTLNWLIKDSNWVSAYMQWWAFIWLVAATILLVWNGFMLVTGRAKINDVKEKIKNILLWVILITCFASIIKIVTLLINYFFK